VATDDREAHPEGVGGGGRVFEPRSVVRGPLVLTKMCVRAVLEDAPRRQAPGAREACSSATMTFKAALRALEHLAQGRQRKQGLFSTLVSGVWRPCESPS